MILIPESGRCEQKTDHTTMGMPSFSGFNLLAPTDPFLTQLRYDSLGVN